MDISVGERWESFVKAMVEAGRYDSADAVIDAGLRLVEERESKLNALRETISQAIERGGARTSEQVMARVASVVEDWRANADSR